MAIPFLNRKNETAERLEWARQNNLISQEEYEAEMYRRNIEARDRLGKVV